MRSVLAPSYPSSEAINKTLLFVKALFGKVIKVKVILQQTP